MTDSLNVSGGGGGAGGGGWNHSVLSGQCPLNHLNFHDHACYGGTSSLSFSTDSQSNKEFSTRKKHCCKCIVGTAPSVLCDCLQLYTPSCTLHYASDPPDSSHQTLQPFALVPTPFLSLVHLHGVTFPFLSNRNPLWTHFRCNLKTFLFPNL